MRARRATAAGLAAAVAVVLLGCVEKRSVPDDPMLDGDWFRAKGGPLVELLPGLYHFLAGADEKLGTEDDLRLPTVVGDVDLVVRAGLTSFSGPLPPPAPLGGAPALAVAEPAAGGVPVPFVVAASDGGDPAPDGAPVLSPAVEGNPVLVVAFADLDGDGFVGVTWLDGDPLDDDIEELELDPVGRRFARFAGGQAGGMLFVSAAGPAGAPLRLVVTAAAYTGDTSPEFMGGFVPTGPAVLTRVPFLPRLDPTDVIQGGPTGPGDPGPDSLVGVEVNDVFTPDPAAHYGERFTLRTDGSEPSIDVADARSGALARFALAREVGGSPQEPDPSSLYRPGVNASGSRIVLELPRALRAAGGPPVVLRLVPVDRLGNVTDPGAAEVVTVEARGGLAILAPDDDGDPATESFTVLGAAGAVLTVDVSAAGAAARLVVDAPSGVSSLPVRPPGS